MVRRQGESNISINDMNTHDDNRVCTGSSFHGRLEAVAACSSRGARRDPDFAQMQVVAARTMHQVHSQL